MTFEELKAVILVNFRKREMSDLFQSIAMATDLTTLLSAIDKNSIVCAVQIGIVTDDMFDSIDESVLNTHGIYSTGSVDITNPGMDIIILRNASPTITINDDLKYNVYIMGKATPIINVSGNVYFELRMYNEATAQLSQSGNTSSQLLLTDNAQLNFNASGNAVTHLEATHSVSVEYSGTDNTYGNISAYINSTVNVALSGDATIDYSANGNSSVIIPVPTTCDYQITGLSAQQDGIASRAHLSWGNTPSNANVNRIRYKPSSDTNWGPDYYDMGSGNVDTNNTWNFYQDLSFGDYDFKVTAICSDGSEVGQSIISITIIDQS